MRLLVLLGLVVLAVWLLRRALRGPPAPRASKPGSAQQGGELVPCARCGVNVPRSEAREAHGALYCSEDHARLGQG